MVEILASRPLTGIASPSLQRLLREWEERRHDREFPSRVDFNPFDLKYILGNLSLLDVTYDPLRFRYRIHASNLAQRMGKEMTNKTVDDIPNLDHARRARDHFTEVVERRVPIGYGRATNFIGHSRARDCEVLVLPLSSDGRTINILMSAMVWEDV